MANDTDPPVESIERVVEWLASTLPEDRRVTNRAFYARLVIDLLTRPGGLLPGVDLLDYRIQVHRHDPYNVMFRWRNNEGAYQLEGLVIQRHDGEAFKTTDLRSLPWRLLLEDDVHARLEEAEGVSHFIEGAGAIVSDFGTPEAKARWEEERHEEMASFHEELLRTSSRKRYGPEHYVEVARLYDEAIAQGSRAPNRYIAEKMNVRSTSTVKNWVVECRRLGLLPPTEERKARGNR